jgi:hypothetical protein
MRDGGGERRFRLSLAVNVQREVAPSSAGKSTPLLGGEPQGPPAVIGAGDQGADLDRAEQRDAPVASLIGSVSLSGNHRAALSRTRCTTVCRSLP